MYIRHLNDGHYLHKREVTEVSEIPCRLNDDSHEGCNEIPIVPS